MASVFLSYDHDDRARAAPITKAIEKAGHSVWWDQRIGAGAEYNNEIEGAVGRADAVVVLWSQRSVRSAWVRDEAAEGRDQGKLVPATIDGAKPPMGFRQYQTIDLSKYRTGGGMQRINELLEAIDKLAGGEQRTAAAPLVRSGLASTTKWLLTAIAAVLLAGALFTIWRVRAGRSVPVVAVAPIGRSADAETLARNLLVKLASLRSAKTDAVRLIGASPGAPAKADFVFEATSSDHPGAARGTLALLAGNDRSVLWSKDFEAKGGSAAALEQSMAYTAGQVLDCALQASGPSQERLNDQTLKLFLNGCALFGERYRSDPASVVPIFTRVVALVPRFDPAWSKLLLAEAQNTRGQMMFFERWAPGRLPDHILAARKLNPQLPELYLAEAALLPLGALDQRLRLGDEAVRLNPDNPDLRVSRSEFFSAIGRNNDAVDDARRAVDLNPLSPGFQSHLIQMLAYAGQLPAAEAEMRRAQQLWPGSSTIDDARFRLSSRFGDARVALSMLQSPGFRQFYPTQEMEPYLLARIQPTEVNVNRAIAAVQNAELSESRKLVQLVQLLAAFDRNEEIYEVLMSQRPAKHGHASDVLYRPHFRKFRHDRRFMQLAARAGLIRFWRNSGKWPDFCFEADLPYDCKAEAAKLG